MSAKKQVPKITYVRWAISLFIVLLSFYLTEASQHQEIEHQKPPVLYSNVCHDDLQRVYLEAIQNAKHSILLIIYSLSDAKIIKALNFQSGQGVQVKVIHDITTPSKGFQKLSPSIQTEGIKLAGLMHQKILVVDKTKVWIGSANMTSDSLKLHDNLVIGLVNQSLADTIEHQTSFAEFNIAEQTLEYWSFPQKGKEGIKRLIQLIDSSQRSICIAMFTWTHPDLTKAVIKAHERGVHVQIVLDRGQAYAVCSKTLDSLLKAKVDVRLSAGLGLLHHKCLWIDEKILVNGSANWTRSAFTRNQDCFLILQPLNPAQNKKMKEMWKKTRASSNKEHLCVFWQRPIGIIDHFLQPVCVAA